MEKILGIVYAYDVKDAYQEILDLGFSWIRMGICFPWKDRMFGTLCEDYLKDREQMKRAHEAGIQIMPSTPGMGGYYYSETDGETRYRDAWPDFVGEKGTPEYYRNVADTCAFICRDLKGIAGDLWQCMNEIDIPTFSGSYSVEVTTGTARASAEGIVRENPQAKCGINLSRYHEDGLKVADLVYAPGHKFGYIGDDQYFGSWQGKTVESWNDVIEALYARYHLPVLANEWGYSSGGAVKEERPDPALLPEGIPDVCYEKSWFHSAEGRTHRSGTGGISAPGAPDFRGESPCAGKLSVLLSGCPSLLSLRGVRLPFRVLLGHRGRGGKAETGLYGGKTGDPGLLYKIGRSCYSSARVCAFTAQTVRKRTGRKHPAHREAIGMAGCRYCSAEG